MTTNPEDASQTGGTPPPPPGAGTPPPAYGSTPPPAYGSTPPAGGGYGGPPPAAPSYGQQAYGTQPPLSDSDQRMWAMLAHVGGILFSFVAPLVIWLVFKDRGRFVEEQAKEALNFQITLAIAAVAVTIISVVTLGIGSILYLAFIVALVFMIMAAVAANKGEAYRYPLNIRLIK